MTSDARVFYNEVDPFAASWLRSLIAAGSLPAGDVDERDIRDLRPGDLDGYGACHFFAGIGGWPLALRLAGLPDDASIWTGSCPCQPFSAAGRRGGTADERHLWPHWHHLIRECRPATVFGEQVEAAVRLGWLDLVQADLEGEGYAFGAAVLGAHSVGAPHIRQRLWWVAHAGGERREQQPACLWRPGARGWDASHHAKADGGGTVDGAMGDAGGERGGRHAGGILGAQGGGASERRGARREPDEPVDASGVGITTGIGRARVRAQPAYSEPRQAGEGGVGDTDGFGEGSIGRVPRWAGACAERGAWADLEWLPCRDGRARPTQPGLQPLAHGVSGRVGMLRGAGNAIVPQAAAEFVKACL